MSYDARVFNVMIASPGDLVVERNIIRGCIYEWNANHSDSRKIVLLPIGWEANSYPEMGYHPQTILNKQMLQSADLLVGVFWKKIGTETDKYPSGTVEEVESHIAAEKPAMLYFSNKPVDLSELDTEQYAELQKYKVECQKRSYYWGGFKSEEEFRVLFGNHLQQIINKNPIFNVALRRSSDQLLGAPDCIQKISNLAGNMRSELLSFREICGERYFRIREKYGLVKFGKDLSSLSEENVAQYKKDRHEWFDRFSKEYKARFENSTKELIELISEEAKQTPAFNGYQESLKKFPIDTDEMLKLVECLTGIYDLAQGYLKK